MSGHVDVDIWTQSAHSLRPLNEAELHHVACYLGWHVDGKTFAVAVSYAKLTSIDRAFRVEGSRFKRLAGAA
jgi:hypothetical protein